MNGLNALRRMFGLHPMNEAPAAEAPAPAAAATEAPAPTAAPSPVVGMLGADPVATPAPVDAPADGADPAKVDDPATKTEEPEAPAGAPEAYAEFTAPEGIELNPAVLPELQEFFKGLNLPQDKAQAALETLLAIQAKAEGTPEQQAEALDSQIVDLHAQLAEQTRNLPDIGGANFEKSMEVAGKVMAKFATPEFRELINYMAISSHPEFFKFVHSIGVAMSPDVFEHGGAAPSGQKSIADRLWPGSN